MVPSCSLGPTALDALNEQSQFLQVLFHLLASEIVSLASWKRNGSVTKSLWRTELVLQTERRNKLSVDTKVISDPRTDKGIWRKLFFLKDNLRR